MVVYVDKVSSNYRYQFKILVTGKGGYCDTLDELQLIADKHGDLSYQKMSDSQAVSQVTGDMEGIDRDDDAANFANFYPSF